MNCILQTLVKGTSLFVSHITLPAFDANSIPSDITGGPTTEQGCKGSEEAAEVARRSLFDTRPVRQAVPRALLESFGSRSQQSRLEPKRRRPHLSSPQHLRIQVDKDLRLPVRPIGQFLQEPIRSHYQKNEQGRLQGSALWSGRTQEICYDGSHSFPANCFRNCWVWKRLRIFCKKSKHSTLFGISFSPEKRTTWEHVRLWPIPSGSHHW